MKPYLRVTLAYALFGALWIFCSDRLVEALAGDLAGLAYFQTMKGWLFVALSSLLVLTITKRACEDHLRVEAEKLAVFRKTVEGSYHILLNYLNQMQLVTMEADRCPTFDAKVRAQAESATAEATAELMKLRDIQTITAEHIDAVVYEKLRRAKTDGAKRPPVV